MTNPTRISALLSLVALVACRSSTPPKADIQTMNAIVQGSTVKVLEDVRQVDAADDIFLAWVGVENESGVPLNATLQDTNQAVSEILVNARNNANTRSFRMISDQQVKAALRAASISRHEELTLREPRERFVAQLTKEGKVPQYLMFASFTNADSGDRNVKERRFRLTLQMMHATSGEILSQRSETFTRVPE